MVWTWPSCSPAKIYRYLVYRVRTISHSFFFSPSSSLYPHFTFGFFFLLLPANNEREIQKWVTHSLSSNDSADKLQQFSHKWACIQYFPSFFGSNFTKDLRTGIFDRPEWFDARSMYMSHSLKTLLGYGGTDVDNYCRCLSGKQCMKRGIVVVSTCIIVTTPIEYHIHRRHSTTISFDTSPSVVQVFHHQVTRMAYPLTHLSYKELPPLVIVEPIV